MWLDVTTSIVETSFSIEPLKSWKFYMSTRWVWVPSVIYSESTQLIIKILVLNSSTLVVIGIRGPPDQLVTRHVLQKTGIPHGRHVPWFFLNTTNTVFTTVEGQQSGGSPPFCSQVGWRDKPQKSPTQLIEIIGLLVLLTWRSPNQSVDCRVFHVCARKFVSVLTRMSRCKDIVFGWQPSPLTLSVHLGPSHRAPLTDPQTEIHVPSYDWSSRSEKSCDIGHLYSRNKISHHLWPRDLSIPTVLYRTTQQSHTHTHLGGVCMILCCQIYPGMGFKLSVSWQDQLSHGHLCDIVCVLSWYSRNRSWVWRRPKGLSRSCVLQGF
jgi:hypothetical protein